MAGVLDALASHVQNMLTQMAAEELHMLLGVSSEIDNMGIKLRDLKKFLADADRRNITDQSVQEWVRELRDAMYDATDILDLCQLKALERGPMHDAGCFNPLLFCMRNPLHAHDIGRRINNLNNRLDGIKERSASFNFVNLGRYEDRGGNMLSSRSGTRETSRALDELGLVGEQIEEDTRNIVDMLTNKYQSHREYKNILLFAIVGVGGIGKTTLAQKIINNDIIQQEFKKKIWLSVNKDFNPTEILRRAITQAGGDHHAAGNAKETLEQTLVQALKGHKTLIILDDVWDCRAWEGVLRTPLVNAMLAHGSCVLVTTRHDTVACGIGADEPYHHINKLEYEDAWLLLKKQVVRDVNDEPQVETLKDIGMRLVEKCDGLPLAVKVIGGLLRQKRKGRIEWENVLHDFLWSVSKMPKELNYAIYLSYEDLHPSLKPCFLHFSILPRGTLFWAQDIVSMWISEGFVHGTSRELEEIGREYYDELIQRNLLEPEIGYIDKGICNMHDIVRSFALHLFEDEALIGHSSESGISDKLKSQKFTRLSLGNEGSGSHDLEWSSLQTQRSLRTLISVGNIKIKPGDSFCSLSSLRTLHLDSVNFDALAESLCQLKHLRYLSISNSNASRLPENIGKLKFLQVINVLGCQSLSKLPSSIVMLQNLRLLGLHGTNISVVPRNFCGLTSLRKLYGFPAHMDGQRCSLEELEPLSNLTELGVEFLENVPSASFAGQARLGKKNRLKTLSLCCTSRLGDDGLLAKERKQIEVVYDELCPPLCLENLHITWYFGQRLPRWMMRAEVTALQSLRILTMYDLACCTELPNGLNQLPCLEILQISRAPAIKRVEFLQPNEPVGVAFPRLQELNTEGMVEWEEWVWEQQVKAMPMLDSLRLRMCKLRRVPPGLAFHAKALKDLYIYDVKHLSYLENFPSVALLDVSRNADLQRISNFPNLQKLVIFSCPKMKVLQGTPELQRLHLEDHDMETLPRYLKDVNPRHLLLDCSLLLLNSIAAGKSGPEWAKLSHILEVKAYADDDDEGIQRKWYVLYRRDPFCFETNISHSAIATASAARIDLKIYACRKTCSIEEEWTVGRHVSTDKRQPLCLGFRCNAYRHLAASGWLRQACLHCCEADGMASTTDQWIQAAEGAPYAYYSTS